jgi:hypothetical protein
MCKETGVKLDKEYWYQHVPKLVAASQVGKVTMLWNQKVQTDRTIPTNKLGIMIRKGKAIPLQAWTGPCGSRRLRLPDY